MMTPSGFARFQHRRGFSAVEVIAVATIISILALILIPVLTKQVEKSRGTAGTDEMGNLAKVITLAHAETNHYFRLQDYDNSSIIDKVNGAINDPSTEVPVTYWGMTTQLSASERNRLSNTWGGPRTVFHNKAKISELYASYPKAFTEIRVPVTAPTTNVDGPIHVFTTKPLLNDPVEEPFPTLDERHDLYPVDQWGNPYFFFASGTIDLPGGLKESIYSPVIYSLGPDGYPGDKVTPDYIDFYPSNDPNVKRIGSEGPGIDDITWKF